MEFCNGGTLIDLIKEREKQKLFLEEWEIKELFTNILKGMQYIRIFMKKQNKNMILMHRDLKPDNFFFKNIENNQKILKIGDFGNAKTYRPVPELINIFNLQKSVLREILQIKPIFGCLELIYIICVFSSTLGIPILLNIRFLNFKKII